MKKLATLLLAAGMVVAASAPANAVDVKVDARYRLSFATGQDFEGLNKEDMRHRMRLGLTMAASENLSARVLFQINHGDQFGATTKHGNEGEISARELYLDWTVPGTAVKVRMGRQGLGLPADAFGNNSVLGAGYGSREGIVLTAPVTDWLGLTGIWTRLGIANNAVKTQLNYNDTDDMYAVAANLKFNGVSGAIYGAFATLDDTDTAASSITASWNGGRPTGAGNAYWVGFTSTVSMFDPFVLKLSAAYGEFDGKFKENDQDGWNVQAKASYKTAYGTPVLGGWYFSGADKNENGGMPSAGYFNGMNHYYDGFAALNNGPANTNNLGTWAVQAGIEGVSFISGLAHDLHVTYMEGTNHKDHGSVANNILTEEDSLVEISLNNTYKVYKNLTARLELAYIISDIDNENDKNTLTEDDWFAGLTFDYKF